MTVTPDPAPFGWLPLADVLAWLKLDADPTGNVERCRVAAAAYCEQQRPDLVDPTTGAWTTTSPALELAGILAAARLYARQGSPAGLASFGEFGAVEVLRLDPDVARLLGTGRNATPRVG